MPDILIRGMEMPRRREVVFLFAVDCDGKVYNWASEELPHLKAIDVPEHGRLIDANALWVKIHNICDSRDAGIITDLTCIHQILSALRHAPTVIPAESEDDNG